MGRQQTPVCYARLAGCGPCRRNARCRAVQRTSLCVCDATEMRSKRSARVGCADLTRDGSRPAVRTRAGTAGPTRLGAARATEPRRLPEYAPAVTGPSDARQDGRTGRRKGLARRFGRMRQLRAVDAVEHEPVAGIER